MTRHFGSPHGGDDHSCDRNKQGNSGQYGRSVGDLASGLGVHGSNPCGGFGVVGHFNSHLNRRADLTGISINAPGRSAVTQYTSGAEIIRFPSVSLYRPIAPLKISNSLQTSEVLSLSLSCVFLMT
jgi:hypothetical protein